MLFMYYFTIGLYELNVICCIYHVISKYSSSDAGYSLKNCGIAANLP